MNLVLQLALSFLGVAFFSIGGASALIPEFHRQIVGVHGWLSDSDFAHMVALAQVAPGPNMLIVSLIGYRVAGVPGLLASTLAIVGPPSVIAFSVGRVLGRLQEARWLAAVKTGLAPVVVGLMLASGLITAQAANHSAVAWGLTGASAIFMYAVKRNPLWVIGGGALVGVAASRAGLI
ncbi:MAG: chromate transporter [Hyphomicrobiales bacterium]|nr:chromate transporter [Hyphomicrobiales bacterium]